jgi:Zn-dependent alcohol dehydrogenase
MIWGIIRLVGNNMTNMDTGERVVFNYAKAAQERRALEAITHRECAETGEKPGEITVIPDLMTLDEMTEWKADGNCGCSQCVQRAVNLGLIEDTGKKVNYNQLNAPKVLWGGRSN